MNDEIKILLADDHPIVRKGLRQVLEAVSKLKVTEEAGDGETAVKILEECPLDVAIIDINMPKMNGLDVVKKVSRLALPVEFIIMTMYKDESIFNRAMDLGVKGYVLKENAITDIVNCVNAVIQGKYYISPLISEFLVRRSGRLTAHSKKIPGIDDLTMMERKVLKLLSEMKTSKEIANELFISTKTVENHRNNICKKLEIHGNHALLKFAIEYKSSL